MTIILSPEALDLVQRARQNLAAVGPEGHTGNVFWTADDSCRCTWGRIMEAYSPGHSRRDTMDLWRLKESGVGLEIGKAFFKLIGQTIDEANYDGFERSLAALDALILAADPGWTPSAVQDSQHEAPA